MIPRIPVIVDDGVGKPYMMRVEQMASTPEESIIRMNKKIAEIGFPMIRFALASEQEFAEYCRAQTTEKRRMEQA